MDLIKDNWGKEEIEEFQKYLKGKRNSDDKIKWSRKILNISKPLLGISMSEIRKIANKIYKGNYIEFLDNMICEYHENILVYGCILNNIKDFNLKIKYLDFYSGKVESWDSCDLLKFNIRDNEEKYITLSKSYIKSDKPFKRRIGIIILFSFIKTKKEKEQYNLNYDKYIDEIFNILNQFKDERNYYVNMVNAWILCELFILEREKILKFLNNHNLNEFTINKAIQKCRDSYRVSKEDKEMLLKYKVK